MIVFGVVATWCDFGTGFTFVFLGKANDRFEGIELKPLSETGWQLSFNLYFSFTV